MINVVSRQAHVRETTGPQKVYANLLKGLDRIGYPYVVNRTLDATTRLWIQDDVEVLSYMHRTDAKTIVGPNLFCLPRDVPDNISLDGALYIQPSEGISRLWRQLGFDRCPFVAWPAGIHTDEFRPSTLSASSRQILVYHKERSAAELQAIESMLDRRDLSYRVLRYGSYREAEFRELLDSTSFVIWHGRHESQGIAFEEVLACDIPVLLCDVSCLGDDESAYEYESSELPLQVTAAPYFDETCGIRILGIGGLGEALDEVLDGVGSYRPREFVLRNLSLEGQARAFVRLWNHFGLTLDDGYAERLRNQKGLTAPVSYKAGRAFRRLESALARRVRR